MSAPADSVALPPPPQVRMIGCLRSASVGSRRSSSVSALISSSPRLMWRAPAMVPRSASCHASPTSISVTPPASRRRLASSGVIMVTVFRVSCTRSRNVLPWPTLFDLRGLWLQACVIGDPCGIRHPGEDGDFLLIGGSRLYDAAGHDHGRRTLRAHVDLDDPALGHIEEEA